MARGARKVEAGPVYVIRKTKVSGSGTSIDPDVFTESKEQLIDAIFLATLKGIEQGRTDIKYDKILLTNGNQEVSNNDIIESGVESFVVVDMDVIEPSNKEVLLYRSYLSKT